MGFIIYICGGVRSYFFDIVLFYVMILFTFTNSVDPDEMQHNAAFHLGIHFLQKYSFWAFQNLKS